MSASDSDSTVRQEGALFRDLNADDDPEVIEIESLCLKCQENGTTRLLLTKIPFFKDVVLMSFCCDNCHWENNELQPASMIQEKGVSYKLKVNNPKDLSRTVVKTEWACIRIPELEFEIPSQSQEGTVTNIEGTLQRVCAGLDTKIKDLKLENSDDASKLEDFFIAMQKLTTGTSPFTFILYDFSGNSYLENLCAPNPDPQLEVSHFERSREEDLILGICASQHEGAEITPAKNIPNPSTDITDLTGEVFGLPTNCNSCNSPCVTNMKVIQIPYFKDVVIMCTVCDVCGHKTSEVKSGCGIEPQGVRATLNIEDSRDLSRDVLKSDTCGVSIKELELDVGMAAFGSRYSTVEGILTTIKEQLKESNPFITGDSADLIRKERMDALLSKIDEIIAGNLKVTFVMDDSCGNSYIQSLDDLQPDKNLKVEKYDRTEEQDDELGLLDMKVENYEES